MKRFFLILVLCVAALCVPALADETVRVDCAPLALNGEWVDGAMRPDEYHYYPVTVTEVGRVTMRVQSFYANAVFEVLDADLVSWNTAYLGGSAGAPETYDFIYYLEPGDYYLRVDGNSSAQGDYRVKASIEPCACDETEPNDDYHRAQTLESDVVFSGVLTQWDEHDYYTFTLADEAEVHLTVHSESDEQQMLTLYDGDMVEIRTEYQLQGYAEDMLLSAGTYYLDVQSGKGPYTIKAVYPAATGAE